MARMNLAMPGRQVPVTRFGGLFTLADPRDYPAGASWLAQDVDFLIAGVGPRAGLTSAIGFQGPHGQAQWFAEAMLGATWTLLAQDTLGNLWDRLLDAGGPLAPFYSGILNGARALGFAANLREYLCLSNVSNVGAYPSLPTAGTVQGTDQPRQYDGTYLDRISQMGPGVGPTVATVESADTPSAPTLSSVAGGGLPARTAWVVVSYQTAAGSVVPSAEASILLGANTLLVVDSPPGATGATGWNVYVSEQEAGAETQQNTGALAIGTNWTEPTGGATTTGVAAPVAQVTAGPRYAVVFYLTRSGYLTPASPPTAFTTTASTVGLTFSNLCIGPANVLQRILAWTPANAAIGGPYYYVPGNVSDENGNAIQASIVADNIATTLTINISDQVLAAGIAVATPGNNLFQARELGEPVKGVQYAGRTFFMGARNKVDQFLNTTFDGGYAGDNPVSGWTAQTPDPGVLHALVASPIFGFSYHFTNGSGHAVNPAPTAANLASLDMLAQGAAQTAFGTPILVQGRRYGVRATAWSPSGNSTGQVWIGLASVSAGLMETFAIEASSLTATPQEFIGPMGAPERWNTLPSDLQLVTIPVGWPAGADLEIDRIEIFDWDEPVLQSQVMASYGEQPEAFDGVTGLLDISNYTTDPITNIFRFLNLLYICTGSRWFSTQDNGTTEPDGWTISEVSNAVGCLGPMADDVGEEFMLAADLRGVWIFDGGSHVKLSQEVQQLWDALDFSLGSGFWLKNDRHMQRVLLGCAMATPGPWTRLPTAVPTQNNLVLLCSYLTLAPGSAIAMSPGVAVSMFTGDLLWREGGRKWAVWSIPAWYADWVVQPDGSEDLWLGSSAKSKIYLLDATNATDDGAQIPEAYGTSNFSGLSDEQQLQLGSVRKMYGPLSVLMDVVGQFVLTVYPETNLNPNPVVLPPLGGNSPARGDSFLPISVGANRVFLLFETAGLTSAGAAVLEVQAAAPGNFTVPHGLGKAPLWLSLLPTSAGAIWAQTPAFDAVNLYLTASDAGVTAEARMGQAGAGAGSSFTLRKIVMAAQPHPRVPVTGRLG